MGRLVLAATVLAFTASALAQSAATLTLTTKPSPLGVGQNLFEVVVKDAKGRAVTNAEVVLLLVMPADPKTKHPEMRTEGKLNNAGRGKYSGIVIVGMAGDWDVTVTATQKGKELARTQQRLTAYLTRPAPKK